MISSMNIANWIARHAAFSPHKTAIRFEGTEISYAAMAREVETAAQVLKWELGVGRGDRIAVLGTNSPEQLILLFACARLGAMMIPLNWRLAVPEHLYILHDASAKVLFVEKTFADRVPPVLEAMPRTQIVGLDYVPESGSRWQDMLPHAAGDSYNPHVTLDTPLLVVYTSGTTGHPKGAVLTQNALQWNAINSLHLHDMTSQDHILTPLPLFHVGGLNNQTTPALHCGATVTLHRRFDPDQTLAAIVNDRPSLTCLVPATMQACITSELWETADFSDLRILLTGSTAVQGHLSDSWRAKGVTVLEMYGATETCPIAIYQRPDSDFSKTGSIGKPALHCQVLIVDGNGQALPPGREGEVLIKGPNVMLEYWGNDAATADTLRNGWYSTGDIGMVDDEGYFYIRDRKKNMIVSGGENIYPAEVERVLYTHPDVAETAVIGFPDGKWQEIPVAVVVLKANSAPSEADLINYMSGELASYKVPKRIVFTDSLPKNGMGKIQHFRVKALFQGA